MASRLSCSLRCRDLPVTCVWRACHRHGTAWLTATGAIVEEFEAGVTLCDTGTTGRRIKGGQKSMTRSVALSPASPVFDVDGDVAWQ